MCTDPDDKSKDLSSFEARFHEQAYHVTRFHSISPLLSLWPPPHFVKNLRRTHTHTQTFTMERKRTESFLLSRSCIFDEWLSAAHKERERGNFKSEPIVNRCLLP
jgi:hypothetical protein